MKRVGISFISALFPIDVPCFKGFLAIVARIVIGVDFLLGAASIDEETFS